MAAGRHEFVCGEEGNRRSPYPHETMECFPVDRFLRTFRIANTRQGFGRLAVAIQILWPQRHYLHGRKHNLFEAY